MQTELDNVGVDRLMAGIYGQAAHDYRLGRSALLSNHNGRIPIREDFEKRVNNYNHTSRTMRSYYETKKFFIDDPYGVLKNITGEEICNMIDRSMDEDN